MLHLDCASIRSRNCYVAARRRTVAALSVRCVQAAPDVHVIPGRDSDRVAVTIRLIVMLFVASSISVQAAAAKKSVQVGSFTVGGTNSFGTAFSWFLDVSAITSEPVCFGGVTWIVDGVSHTFLDSAFGDGFVMCTLPLFDPPYPNTFGVLGCDPNTPDCWSYCLSTLGTSCTVVLPSCYSGCTNITLQLLSLDGKSFSFTLFEGKKFKTYGVNTSSMSPQPGQLYITPGQSAPLYLYRDPSGK